MIKDKKDKYLDTKAEVLGSDVLSIKDMILSNGLILCREVIMETKTKGGIIVPGTTDLQTKNPSKFFRVLKIDTHNTEIAKSIQVKPGDIISANGGYDVFREGIQLLECKQGNILEYWENI